MKKSPTERCPCGSNAHYPNCCGQQIDKEIPAPTAEQLMRSRYSAYTRNNSDYLLKTWHESTRPASLDLTQQPQPEWLGLKVCRTEGGDKNHTTGEVEFIARYKAEEITQVIFEVSRFIKEEGRWYYVDGTLSQPSQNTLCPCGSGKKFKRCCGK